MGTTDADIERHFGGEPLSCEECHAEDQTGGVACSRCGEYVATAEERREAAEEAAAEAQYDAARDRGTDREVW